MNEEEYSNLVKKATKESGAAKADNKSPFLPVLDKIIENIDIVARANLGLITIPIEQIAGTDTQARANAFSPSFLPLLDATSEFASKYINLYNSCEEEGLREPVTGFEFLGKYYIREGNKRVSVAKQLGMSEIEGHITRLVPVKTDEPEIVLNYEYIRFYEKTGGVNFLYFSKCSYFKKFIGYVAGDGEFNEEHRLDVHSSYIRFKKEFDKKQKNLPMSSADAYYNYVKLFGFDEVKENLPEKIHDDIDRIWKELWTLTLEKPIVVSEKPLKKNVPLIKKIALKAAPKSYKVAFVHLGNIENSPWVYSHELGRQYLEQSELGDIVDSTSFFDVSVDDADDLLENICREKYKIIFVTSAQLSAACTKVAINHPEVKILNCSLNDSTRFVRTYYLRTYEIKYLLGMMAGALTQTGRIAYVADYPIYGTIASINAFALGVSTINPSARLYLSWISQKGDPYRYINEAGCDIISNLDWSSPKNLTKKYGLYANEENPVSFAAPLWDWGKLYKAIIDGIRKGNWDVEEDEAGSSALSYWWGISSGAVDMIYSNNVPPQTIRLVNYIKDKICKSEYDIFCGELKFSDGTTINSPKQLAYIELIKMDKLLWNIIGSIPSKEELKEEIISLTEAQGALEKEE